MEIKVKLNDWHTAVGEPEVLLAQGVPAELIEQALIELGEQWKRAAGLMPNEVAVDRARFERLREAARGWVSECDRHGDGPGDAMRRAGLEPTDFDDLP